MKLSIFWRLVATTALAAFAGCVWIIIDLTISTPLLLLLTLTTAGVSCYGVWLIFTGTGARQAWGWVVALTSVIALFIEIIFLIKNSLELGQLILLVILATTYVLLLRILRRQYWIQKRALKQDELSTTSFKQPVLIINPKSGNGRAIKAGIDRLARDQGIRVMVTKKTDSIEGLARAEAKKGADVLGVSGGDGTLGAVAKVALECNLPLVILPGGTRCHFARDLGLDPEQIVDSLASFHGVERRIDVGDINGRIFLNNASFGLYADIVDEPNYREHKVATSRTVLKELLDGSRPRYSLNYKDGQGKRHATATQLLVGVNEYQTLKLFELGHRDKLDAGVLQVTAITELNDQTIRQLMTTLTLTKFFSDKTPDNFQQWTTTSFTVNSKQSKLIVGVDGEREAYAAPVKVTIRHKALRVIVPPEGIRDRRHSPIGRRVITKLLEAVSGRVR